MGWVAHTEKKKFAQKNFYIFWVSCWHCQRFLEIFRVEFKKKFFGIFILMYVKYFCLTSQIVGQLEHSVHDTIIFTNTGFYQLLLEIAGASSFRYSKFWGRPHGSKMLSFREYPKYGLVQGRIHTGSFVTLGRLVDTQHSLLDKNRSSVPYLSEAGYTQGPLSPWIFGLFFVRDNRKSNMMIGII